MKQVIIDSEGKQCRPIYPECIFVDSTPRKGSMNPISSDAVFNAVSGATELPSYDESNEGQILKVKDDASGVEWSEAPVGLPDMTGQDGKILGAVDVEGAVEAQWINPPTELPASIGTAGQVLTVNAGADGVEWATPAQTTYTASTGINITSNVISADIDNSTIKTALAPSVIQSARNLIQIATGYGAFEINSDVKAKLTQSSSASGSKLQIHVPGNLFSYAGNVTSGSDSSVYVQLCSDQYFNPGNSTAIFPVALTNTYNSQTQKTYIDEQDVEISCYMADWLSGADGSPLAPTTLNPATSSASSHWYMGFFRGDGTHTSTQAYAASSASLPPGYAVVISEEVASNKICVANPVPAFTSLDNGKVLGVVNGALAWVSLT